MHLRTRRLVIFLGGVVLASGGLVIAACTTDNGKTRLPTTDSPKDSGTPTSSRERTLIRTICLRSLNRSGSKRRRANRGMCSSLTIPVGRH